ncbi:Glyoxylate reductase/hydroxypyruvate reductase [Folsomia candida]|uniref:Glyoxylate reductase/hydroxypyruvate reductase n=1 Tax=Folsomia candida TaxID=158441 RepID=A0A226CXB9_FOLCA|nr:Glyoxylate reductase/hydroxypyruvate reductase [Folsomia candida]
MSFISSAAAGASPILASLLRPSTIVVRSKSKVIQSSSPLLYRNMATQKPKVFVTRPDVPKPAMDLLRERCDVTTWGEERPVPRDYFLKNVSGVDGIFCLVTDRIDAEVLDAAGPQLKVVGTMSVGVDHVDIGAVKSRNIRLGYTPNVLTDATAETTVIVLLSASRRVFEARDELMSGRWGRARGDRLTDAEFVDFDTLCKESDFIICTAALTPDTKEIFNARAFSLMKPNAVFVNSSRGGTVEQDALIKALKTGQIFAAGLDVMTPEPLPVGHELTKLKNCAVLPHIGSATIQARMAMAMLTTRNILAALDGKPMPESLN